MNEEIDDNEFFHQDFTTASDWEIFIARIEEIIHEWRLGSTKDEELEDFWLIKSENLPFADTDFTLTLYRNKNCVDEVNEEDATPKNPMDSNFDFILSNKNLDSHPDLCLYKWYGCNEFIVLSPLASLVTETKIKILLSSLHVVFSDINCEIPLFVQIREKRQNCYLGVYEGNGCRTSFDMIHLRRGPQHCQYVTGLLDLFKTKIMSPVALDTIIVSVQLSYTLSDFGAFVWKQDNSDVSEVISSLFETPLGVTIDPVESMFLKTTWSHLPDNLIVDSESYSNFDPLQAQKWSVVVKFAKQPICILSDLLTEFMHVLMNDSSIYDVLGDYAAPPMEVNNPLDLLTESKIPTITGVLKRAARNSLSKVRRGAGPLPEDILVAVLYYLFPDAHDDSPLPYCDVNNRKNENSDGNFVDEEERFRGFKTCRIDSLVWRLSVVLAHTLQSLGGYRGMAHLWYEFVQEARYRYEKSILLPGVAPGFPDPRTCLLHQKLQMINCCIERKKSRMQKVKDYSDDQFEEANSSTDDDEFYDCSDDDGKGRDKHSLWNQPVGRLGKFEDLKLLKTGDQLYIPITQDPVPKTEDQLEEDTDILMKLGSDAAGSELRARMMSASLLSDMESFKAANPGSVLEDFIRWYSPRDWIVEEGVDEFGQAKGHLSSRMLISNNTWMDTWKSAKPVPANRQKRLFDDTREAEKVLHFLDSRSLAQVTEMLLPVFSQAAVYRLSQECDSLQKEASRSEEMLEHLIKISQRFSREAQPATPRYERFIQEVSNLELLLSQANSLIYKFNPAGGDNSGISELVKGLIAGNEVEIEIGSKEAERLVWMFSEAQNIANLVITEHNVNEEAIVAFPQATEREFVMRVSAHRPAAYSTKSTQFLRAILSKNEFRIAGAFTEDIVFF